MFERSLPGGIDLCVIDRTHLVVVPTLESVHQSPRVAGVHVTPFHGHLARAEILGVVWQLESREVGVHAVLTTLRDRRDDKLVEGCPTRRLLLVVLAAVLADDPILDVRPVAQTLRLNDQVLILLRHFRANLLESFLARRVHDDPHTPLRAVERNGATKLRRRAGEENFLALTGELLQDCRRGERVTVHNSRLEILAVLIHEQRTSTVQRFILIQRSQPNNFDARLVRLQNCLFNLPVDVIKLTLDEELKPPRRRDPCLARQLAQPVTVGDERLAKHAQQEHKRNAERPERLEPPRRHKRPRGKAAKHKRQVENAQKFGTVRHEHHIRSRDWNRFARDSLLIQLVRRHIRSAVDVVVERHEEAKVGVHARVVQRVVTRGVNQVLHPGNAHKPSWDELKVAVTDGVEHIKPKKVNVKHGDGRAAERPRSEERNSEIRCVHQVLHKRMHAPSDWFRHERRVMVRVIRIVQFVMMQRAVKPVVNKLSRPRVQERQLRHADARVRRKPAKPELRHPVHRSHHEGLKQYVIIPVVLSVHLLKINPFRLNPRPSRERVHSRQAYPDLRVYVTQRRDRAQVPAKVIRIIPTRHRRDNERHHDGIL